MTKPDTLDRRTYLKAVGSTGVAFAVAGCSGPLGGGTEIVPGTAPGFKPFEFKEEGELKGFDIDLLEAVVEQTDYTLGEWKEFEFKTLIPSLTSGKIDVIAAGMTINTERDEQIDFSDPYYSSDQSVLVREDGSFSPAQFGDLASQQIGAQKGTTGKDLIQSELIDTGELESSDANFYDNYVLAVQDLENGNIDAVVVDKPVGEAFQSNRAVTIAFTVTTDEQFGFGLRDGDDETTQALNSGLQAVRDDGTYQELTAEWFGE